MLVTTTVPKTNHTCAPLPADPSLWSEAELAEALAAGHPQAETEHTNRIYARKLGIIDRRNVMPAWAGGIAKPQTQAGPVRGRRTARR